MTIQQCSPKNFSEISEFLWQIYETELAEYNGERGHHNFRSFIHPAQFNKRYRQGAIVIEALDQKHRMGMCEYRNQHVFLLFVAPQYRRRGLASSFMNQVKESVEARHFSPFITLNASPNAVSFYEKRGFVALKSEETINGLRSTPMKRTWKREP